MLLPALVSPGQGDGGQEGHEVPEERLLDGGKVIPRETHASGHGGEAQGRQQDAEDALRPAGEGDLCHEDGLLSRKSLRVLYIVAPKIFAVNGRGWRSSALPEGADLVTSIEGV